MKAAVFHGPQHIEVRSDVARPRIAANEVLVQVQACGICGSDLHIYRVKTPLTDLLHIGTLLVDRDGHAIPGHEFSGVIVETGAEGGIKQSGIGVEFSPEGIKEFTGLQVVSIAKS